MIVGIVKLVGVLSISIFAFLLAAVFADRYRRLEEWFPLAVAAAVLVVLANVAWGQDAFPSEVSDGHDTIRLQQGDPFPEVFYSNSADRRSGGRGHTLQLGPIIVDVFITLNADGENERIRVVPRDESGVLAYPPEAIVPDGETEIIQLMPPMG